MGVCEEIRAAAAAAALVMAVAIAALMAAAASHRPIVFDVGGPAGWTLPTPANNLNYTAWADSHTFVIGDILYFGYERGSDSVALVSRLDFGRCNSSSPLAAYGDGASNVTLYRAGTFYFVSGLYSHCRSGQRLAVHVRRHPLRSSQPSNSSVSPSPASSSPSSSSSGSSSSPNSGSGSSSGSSSGPSSSSGSSSSSSSSPSSNTPLSSQQPNHAPRHRPSGTSATITTVLVLSMLVAELRFASL